jgi:hypothetical protein
MVDMQVATGTVLRATLLDIGDVVALVGDQVYWEHADADAEMPYIIISHGWGGLDKQMYPEGAVDQVWKVCGVTPDMLTKVALSNAIAQLHWKLPIIPEDTGACSTTRLVQLKPYSERTTPQNVPIHEVGGYFRIILTI